MIEDKKAVPNYKFDRAVDQLHESLMDLKLKINRLTARVKSLENEGAN